MKAPEWVFVSEQAVKSQIVPNDEYNNSKEGKNKAFVLFTHLSEHMCADEFKHHNS